jgi:superfamily II DNA/RNA helicase
VRLDGDVPQQKRQSLVHEFQTNPQCRFFLTTNAGSTGLNLQAANTVINVDLPWNPAILEQRIARAHRMGQMQPVQAFMLVTEGTLEESLLKTLSAKRDLALAALDASSEVETVSLVSGAEEIRARLEVLLGAKPEAPLDVSQQRASEEAARGEQDKQRRERVASAAGELLGAVFNFLGELVQDPAQSAPSEAVVQNVRNRLGACVAEDGADRAALDRLSQVISRLLVAEQPAGEPTRA